MQWIFRRIFNTETSSGNHKQCAGDSVEQGIEMKVVEMDHKAPRVASLVEQGVAGWHKKGTRVDKSGGAVMQGPEGRNKKIELAVLQQEKPVAEGKRQGHSELGARKVISIAVF